MKRRRGRGRSSTRTRRKAVLPVGAAPVSLADVDPERAGANHVPLQPTKLPEKFRKFSVPGNLAHLEAENVGGLRRRTAAGLDEGIFSGARFSQGLQIAQPVVLGDDGQGVREIYRRPSAFGRLPGRRENDFPARARGQRGGKGLVQSFIQRCCLFCIYFGNFEILSSL